jgi:hypothetical protein
VSDPVNPDHYKQGAVEAIDGIRSALGLIGFVAYCQGNILKYAWRLGRKDSSVLELRKIAWYANRAADELEKP